MKALLEPDERAKLRQFLTNRFSLTELKNLAFDLGVDYELLLHDTTPNLARELIAHLDRKDQLDRLLTEITRLRPDNELERLLDRFSHQEMNNKGEDLQELGDRPFTPLATPAEGLYSRKDRELTAKRSELSIARGVLKALQEADDTPGYKILEQKQYVQKLEKQIREIEEDLEAKGQFAEGHAVVIGVGVDLPVTVQDATAFADFLKQPERCAYPEEQVDLLAGYQATRTHILAALDGLARSVTQNSTAIVYFSGHGYHVASPNRPPVFYLLPYGYDINNLPQTCISGKEFTDKLQAIRSKKLLVLLDCCHAGGIAQPKAPDVKLSKAPLPLQAEVLLAEGSGRVILASSRADEKSYTSKPYSQFTIALLESLAGAGAAEKDGYVRVLDVALYVGRMVPNRTHDAQHPMLKVSNLENNFVLAYYAGGSQNPMSIPKLVEAQVQSPPIEPDIEISEGYRKLLNRYRHHLLEVEMRMAEFIDQRAIPLDLLQARDGVIKKIEELERKWYQK